MSLELLIEDGDELFTAMHTALRKCCDSGITSVAWNLINELPTETGRAYFHLLWEHLQEVKPENKIELRDTTKYFSEYTYQHLTYRSITLWCVLDMFDDDDWDGFLSYTYDYLKIPEREY